MQKFMQRCETYPILSGLSMNASARLQKEMEMIRSHATLRADGIIDATTKQKLA
jgi:hypothetical protein